MKKILIAEDGQAIGKMLERAFRFVGYEVELVSDGKSAFEYLHKTEELPSAIIMDVMMPEMSGLDLLRNIKQETYLKNIPIMILTNSFLKENSEQFLALGADMYLVKIEHKAADIIEKINQLIESKKNKK
jgi:CheY-like chemotaxis protein